jgi:hypothetical protein
MLIISFVRCSILASRIMPDINVPAEDQYLQTGIEEPQINHSMGC